MLLGLTSVLLWIKLGPSGAFFRAAVVLILLLAAAVSDLTKREVPDILSAALVFLGFFSWGLNGNWSVPVLGALTCGGPLLALKLVYPSKIGGGDVKLTLGAGSLTGPVVGAAALGVASVSGLVFALCFRQKQVPFAPFLFTGAAVAFLLLA